MIKLFGWLSKRGASRKGVRDTNARNGTGGSTRPFGRWTWWPLTLAGAFLLGVLAISWIADTKLDFDIGQRIEQPILAKVWFQVPDPKTTAKDRLAARAKTASHYKRNSSALTTDRIRADLLRVYQAAVDADAHEAFELALKANGWPANPNAYQRLRGLADLPNDEGRTQFQGWVESLRLDELFVVQSVAREPRDPASLADYIFLEMSENEGKSETLQIGHSELVPQGNEKALRGAVLDVTRSFAEPSIRPILEAIVFQTFRENPTIVFDQKRTLDAMQKAEAATPEAMTTFEKNKPFIGVGVIGTEDFSLLMAHQAAYLEFLARDTPEARELRRERILQRTALIVLVLVLAMALLVYTAGFQPSLLRERRPSILFCGLLLVTLLAIRLLDMRWPQYPGLQLIPVLMTASILAIVYPQRFAMGVGCSLAVLVTIIARGQQSSLLALLAGTVVTVHQLNDIRSRTKLPTVGVVTAVAVMIVAAAGALAAAQPLELTIQHALFAGACAIVAAAVIAWLLPYIEHIFETATSLTLLEWRDPTRPLLQLLAREAPGTYNHSLVLGTLAEAACNCIGANGLLTQVGALYHDIGKIHRPAYFTENQEGRVSRHDNLAPTMSLLIILGHVKDGLEMARQFKLPKVLHQFIAEHHGTTVVRYFHRVASDKQPQIASGRHDRAVSEADFRYGGPRPRSRESAVLMMCDSVEGAVRALGEPTVGRIESTVQHIIADRLNDGQFDECDITLREIRLVEDSLVRTLCSIYHGRVAYPKAPKAQAVAPREERRVSV